MTAMLGMYDLPALQPANDRFWSLIRQHLGRGPDTLTRDRVFWDIWLDPEMVFSQTCGMPYRTRLHGRVQIVGTPDYGLPGCPPGHYCSVFVARKDDPRSLEQLTTGTFAYNEALSQSGWAAAVTHLAELGLAPRMLLESGGHARSAQAVAEGKADFASLDALTWELLKQHTDLRYRLREVDRTEPTPTLPYITSDQEDASAIARAVRSAISDLSDTDRQLLHLRQMVNIPAQAYLAIPTPPGPEVFARSP